MATETLEPTKKGEHKITFHKGGLHESTGTPMGQKIPVNKIRRAMAGGFGLKAKKQAEFMKNVLKR